MSAADGTATRTEALAEALTQVRTRIGAACATAGRDAATITLIGVTKTFPAVDAIAVVELGVRDLGENRDQEARAKAAELAEAGVDVRWHLVGRLQRNKARSVAAYADVVHSVDRLELAVALGQAALRRDRTLDALVQVSLDTDPDERHRRGGAAPDAIEQVAAAIAEQPSLTLRGLMAVAPREGDPAAAFARLAEVSAALQRQHPGADWLSAGMSADLEQAIAAGATHLRVGTALLGGRSAVLG